MNAEPMDNLEKAIKNFLEVCSTKDLKDLAFSYCWADFTQSLDVERTKQFIKDWSE